MIKTLLIFLLCTSSFAQVSREKASYLVEVLELKSNWTSNVDTTIDKFIISSPVLKLVKDDLRKYIEKKHPPVQIQEQVRKRLSENLSVDEINKVIAIYELPVMKKLLKELSSVDKDFIAKASLSLKKKDFELLKIKDLAQRKLEELKKKR